MASNGTIRMPTEAFPVCAFVLEEIEAREWSLDDLAIFMGGRADVNRLALDILIHCHDDYRMELGEHMAWQLAIAFGVSSRFFLNLDAAYRASLPSPTKAADRPEGR